MLKLDEVNTWKDLLEVLKKCSPEQLNQKIQVCTSHPVEEQVLELQPAYCIGTVKALELLYCRSSVDNKKNEEEVVLCVDYNPFAVDGAIAYEWGTFNDETSEFIHKNKPIYPKNYSDEQNWTGPAQKIIDSKNSDNNQDDSESFKLSEKQALLLKNRILTQNDEQ